MLLDDICFLLWQHIGLKLDAKLIRDCLGRGHVVPRDHDDLQTGCLQLTNRIRRGILDWIGDAYDSSRFAIHGNQHHRVALLTQSFGAFEQWCWIDFEIVEELGISDRDLFA